MTTTLEPQSTLPEQTFLDAGPRLEELGLSHPHPLYADENSAGLHSWSRSATKRSLDFLLALGVLGVFLIPGIVVYFLVRLTSPGPGLFKQTRVGFEGRLFTIFKFRTMQVRRASKSDPCLTRDGDHRITLIGGLLRKFKLDEVPQFYNVLRGDMSVVGPRPKLRQYVSDTDLRYRPGITGPATLFFRDEERLLAGIPADDLDAYYETHIKPLKATIDLNYMERATLFSDLRIILATAFPSLRPTIKTGVTSNGAIILETRGGTGNPAAQASEASRTDDFAMIDSM